METEDTCYQVEGTVRSALGKTVDEIQRTEDSLLTPDTHISCDTRLAPIITHDTIADELVEDGAERLVIPCFISETRNKKMGSERKCFVARASRSIPGP